jgi:hypothetical protein
MANRNRRFGRLDVLTPPAEAEDLLSTAKAGEGEAAILATPASRAEEEFNAHQQRW